MAEPRHLRNAPIREAIFDIRVKARREFRAQEFLKLKDRLSESLPAVIEQRGLEAQLKVVKGQPQLPTMQDLGLQSYHFKSPDGKTIAQFRTDGFTFNRLRPYTSWEDLFPQAMGLWRLYISISRPEMVTRLAVRYINRIELLSGTANLGEYLAAPPAIPPQLPTSITSFLTRVSLHDPGRDMDVHVAQVLEGNAPGKPVTVILDIDAFKGRQFSIDDPAIEKTFEELRIFKNLIFFNCLFDDLLRRFE